jgi:hypothetical protein
VATTQDSSSTTTTTGTVAEAKDPGENAVVDYTAVQARQRLASQTGDCRAVSGRDRSTSRSTSERRSRTAESELESRLTFDPYGGRTCRGWPGPPGLTRYHGQHDVRRSRCVVEDRLQRGAEVRGTIFTQLVARVRLALGRGTSCS